MTAPSAQGGAAEGVAVAEAGGAVRRVRREVGGVQRRGAASAGRSDGGVGAKATRGDWILVSCYCWLGLELYVLCVCDDVSKSS